MTSTYTSPGPKRITSYDLSGYEAGPSPWAGDGIAIDIAVAARSRCSYCGHGGCGYRGFHKLGRSYGIVTSYRAFAVCPECGHAEEF